MCTWDLSTLPILAALLFYSVLWKNIAVFPGPLSAYIFKICQDYSVWNTEGWAVSDFCLQSQRSRKQVRAIGRSGRHFRSLWRSVCGSRSCGRDPECWQNGDSHCRLQLLQVFPVQTSISSVQRRIGLSYCANLCSYRTSVCKKSPAWNV